MASPIVRRYIEEHKTGVKQVFRNLPLTQLHQNAFIAAEAAEAAGEQGKFWEMEEKITTNVDKLSPAYLQQAASELGLDLGKFNAALQDHRFAPKIQADADEAKRLGIQATPTFVINGHRYESGVPTYEQLDAAVKYEASQVNNKGQ